jgi:hypothetical protein
MQVLALEADDTDNLLETTKFCASCAVVDVAVHQVERF